jgi:lysophospholipase L1-like esterase
VRRLSTILLIGLLVGLWPSVNARAATLGPPGDIYLAVGNSLSVGAEAPANNDGQPGYPNLLLPRLQELNPSLRLELLGVAGETSATMISDGQLDAAESVISSAAAAGQCVGVITVDIGGNDFGQILTGETTPATAIPQFEANLNTILGRIGGAAHSQVAGCIPHMAIMDYYNPYPGLPIPPSNQPLSDIYLPELNAIIRTVAATHGWAVTHVESAFRGREAELLYVNQGIYTNPLLRIPFTPWFAGNVDFHPRPAGHEIIAEEFWQTLEIVTPVPELGTLPDLVAPDVALLVPWTCGACVQPGRQLATLQDLPEPATRNIEWLGVQLWNRVTRPLLCWLLAMFQAGLNMWSGMLNTFWIPAFNQLFRLLYELFFWLTSAFMAFWYLGEDLRLQLWGINGSLVTVATALSHQAVVQSVTSGEIASAILAAWVAVFTGALQPWRYLISLYMGTVPQIVDILVHLSDYRPPQLVALDNYWLFAATKGALRGFYESQLGWFLVAQVGLFYLGTVMFLVDSSGEV